MICSKCGFECDAKAEVSHVDFVASGSKAVSMCCGNCGNEKLSHGDNLCKYFMDCNSCKPKEFPDDKCYWIKEEKL